MIRMPINLEADEWEALIVVAGNEKRQPKQQAAMLIRRQLELMGVLKSQAGKGLGTNGQPAQAEGAGQ